MVQGNRKTEQGKEDNQPKTALPRSLLWATEAQTPIEPLNSVQKFPPDYRDKKQEAFIQQFLPLTGRLFLEVFTPCISTHTLAEQAPARSTVGRALGQRAKTRGSRSDAIGRKRIKSGIDLLTRADPRGWVRGTQAGRPEVSATKSRF